MQFWEIVVAVTLFVAAVVLDFVLLVRDARRRRALAAASIQFQALIAQYQSTLEQQQKQLQDAGVAVHARDMSVAKLTSALNDLNNAIHLTYEQLEHEEDKVILNEAWMNWHRRNVGNLSGQAVREIIS